MYRDWTGLEVSLLFSIYARYLLHVITTACRAHFALVWIYIRDNLRSANYYFSIALLLRKRRTCDVAS